MDNWSCGVDDFAATLDSLLGEVSEGINDCMEPAVKKACSKASRVTKKEANEKFQDIHMKSGRYSSGFSYKIKPTKFAVSGEVGNKKYPGLVHLLEKGHATMGGGRVAGRKHLEDGFNEGSKVLVEEVNKAVDAAL